MFVHIVQLFSLRGWKASLQLWLNRFQRSDGVLRAVESVACLRALRVLVSDSCWQEEGFENNASYY